jgi:hypothetical protein
MPTVFIATVFNNTSKYFVKQKHTNICTSMNVDLEKTELSPLNQSGNYVRYYEENNQQNALIASVHFVGYFPHN